MDLQSEGIWSLSGESVIVGLFIDPMVFGP